MNVKLFFQNSMVKSLRLSGRFAITNNNTRLMSLARQGPQADTHKGYGKKAERSPTAPSPAHETPCSARFSSRRNSIEAFRAADLGERAWRQRTAPPRKELDSSRRSAAARICRERENKERPALDSLFESLGNGAIAVDSDDAKLDVFTSTQIEQGVEERLFGLVAERGEMVQNNEQRHAANLGLLKNLQETNTSTHTISRNSMFLNCAFLKRLSRSTESRKEYDASKER